METTLTLLAAVGSAVATLVVVATGVFSLLSMVWGDLLESEPPSEAAPDLVEAA